MALILLDFLVQEEDVQTPTTSKVPYIPNSHCGNGVACWAPSTGLQRMVCLPRRQSTRFSPCHCQCSNPSPTTLTTQTERRATPLSWPEVGKDGHSVKAAGAGKGGEGGGGNGFFTIIEKKGEKLSVMMDQKYEDVKRSCKKTKPGFSQWWPLRGREEYQEMFFTVKMTKHWHRLSREVVESPSWTQTWASSLRWLCLSKGVVKMTPQRSLPDSAILRFSDWNLIMQLQNFYFKWGKHCYE